MQWGVGVYVEWCETCLSTYSYDCGIYLADITKLESLEKMNLNHALCRFIPEVTKSKGEGLYPGRFCCVLTKLSHLWSVCDCLLIKCSNGNLVLLFFNFHYIF